MEIFFEHITNFTNLSAETNGGAEFADQIYNVLFIILGVIVACALPFAIYLGFKLATAPDEQQRATAKKRFLNVLASMMIIIILMGLLAFLAGDGFLDFT